MKQVWFVMGADPSDEIPVLFTTKIGAEIYARTLWPDVDPNTRYARVRYRSVWEESDMREHITNTIRSQA